MVRINRDHQRRHRARSFAKIETFNPGNSIKDRMAVKMIEDAERKGAAEARRHDHRGHIGQHRDGARHRRGGQGLQVRVHDHRQAVEGEDRRAEGVRRRGDRLPDQRRSRGSAVVLLGVVAPREGSAELVEGEPVRQPVEHGRALRADRSGDLGADRGPRHAPRRRRRHRRHGQRRRPLSEGAQPDDQGVGHRHLRLGVQEVQGDRHLRQARDLSVHHRRHRRGLPAEERRLRRHRLTSRR